MGRNKKVQTPNPPITRQSQLLNEKQGSLMIDKVATETPVNTPTPSETQSH